MTGHSIYFERLSAHDGLTPQDPPRVRIVGPYDARLMAFIDEIPAPERAFDKAEQAWRVSLPNPERLSRFARVVSALDAPSVTPAITAPEVANAVSEYSRRLAPLARAEHEQAAIRTLRISADSETVRIAFDYHRGWNDALRDLPRWARFFDRQDKSWQVARHPQALQALAEKAREADFPADAQQTLDALAHEGAQTSGGGDPGVGPTRPKKSPLTPSLG